MNFAKIIAKGIVVSFIFHLIFATIIVRMDFDMSLANFSVLLMILMAIVSLYVGIISERMGPAAGTLVALGTLVILFLYLNQRVEMNWELNRYLIGVYLLNGFVFSFIGSMFNRKRGGKKPTGKKGRSKAKASPSDKTQITPLSTRKSTLGERLK